MRKWIVVAIAIVTTVSTVSGVLTFARDPSAAIGDAFKDHRFVAAVLFVVSVVGILALIAALFLPDKAWLRLVMAISKPARERRLKEVRTGLELFATEGRLVLVNLKANVITPPPGLAHAEDGAAFKAWADAFYRFLAVHVETHAVVGTLLRHAGAPGVRESPLPEMLRSMLAGVDEVARTLREEDVVLKPRDEAMMVRLLAQWNAANPPPSDAAPPSATLTAP